MFAVGLWILISAQHQDLMRMAWQAGWQHNLGNIQRWEEERMSCYWTHTDSRGPLERAEVGYPPSNSWLMRSLGRASAPSFKGSLLLPHPPLPSPLLHTGLETRCHVWINTCSLTLGQEEVAERPLTLRPFVSLGTWVPRWGQKLPALFC